MSDADLWAAWRVWVLVGAAVVAVAAGLLIAIALVARGILRDAVRALKAAEAIRAQTAVIWELQTSNEVAEQLLETVQSIEARGGAIAAALADGGRVGAGGSRERE